MLKKVLAVALAAAMIFGLVSVAFAASPFPDTAGVPEEQTIALLKTLGIAKGDDAGNFRPYDTINRAEFAAMVVRVLGLENAASYLATQPVFPDVTAPQWAWAFGYINIATTKGIIKGYPDGTFGPGNPVTEAEALTMLLRALGYDDRLPGDWPIDYIMKGAEDGVGLVQAGFVPSMPATRAFIANMIGAMLDAKKVAWDKDKEDFVIPSGEDTFKTQVFGVSDGPVGVVTSVDSTNQKLTVAGEEKYYASNVVIYGNVNSVGDLTGYSVETLTKNDKIIFIAVTNQFVTGKVTAVDVVNNTITIGSEVYPVDSTFAGTKNGVELTGTVQNKLVSLLDTTANLWVNKDGKAYRVEARYLDQTGQKIATKYVSVTPDGTTYKIKFVVSYDDSGNPQYAEYELASTATITKNNSVVGWADLKAGDLCDFALENGKIVWIDAWNQVVPLVRVTAKYDLGTTKQIVVVANGVTTTYNCTDDAFGNPDLTVGGYYDLYLNRSGEVYDFSIKTDSVTTVVGTIAQVKIETSWVNNTPETTYKLILTDGTSIEVPIAAGFDLTRNNKEVSIVEGSDLSKVFTDNFKVGDLVNVKRNVSGTVTAVSVYSPVFEGAAVYAGGELTVGGNKVELDTGAVVLLNGVSVSVSDLNGATARVYWNAETGKASKIIGVKFASATASAVKVIESDADGNYVFTLVNEAEVRAPKDAIVLRDGSAATLASVVLGDKMLYSSDGKYIEVTSDKTAPALSQDPTAVYDRVYKTVTVTLSFKEEVQTPTVYVAGTKIDSSKITTTDHVTFTVVAEGFDTKPNYVTLAISVKDYAGNSTYKTYPQISVP